MVIRQARVLKLFFCARTKNHMTCTRHVGSAVVSIPVLVSDLKIRFRSQILRASRMFKRRSA
jgi:hypothetical protein